MCRSDFDETWEVWNSWWAIGKCCDCGNIGRVLVEELGPEGDEESDDRVIHLILNDGVPDLRTEEEVIWMQEVHSADPSEVFYALSPRIEDTQKICAHCLEARRWLKEWCHTWLYGDYRSDIIEHWTEDEIARHLPFARLVVLARRRWRAGHKTVGNWDDPQPLVPVEDVAQLVDQSLAWLRAQTGKQYAG